MGMFDNVDLINALIGTPEVHQAYAEKYGRPKDADFLPWAANQLMQEAPIALMGLRAAPAAANMKAFNPKAPETPLAKRPTDALSDDGWAQHVYEALLGRTRKPGQAVAEPGSGWWNVLGQPIPKPTNPLPWAGAGGVGYGIWRLGGGQQLLDDWQKLNTPGTPEYIADQERTAGLRAELEAKKQDAEKFGPRKWYNAPGYVTPEQEEELRKSRLPGGVGRDPY